MIKFIGIGATKAGTTWLFDRLRDLDDFRLTPIKELHYFDRSSEYKISPDYLEITKFKNRLFFNKRWYVRFIKDIGRTIFQYPSFYDFKWVIKWHTSNYSDYFYDSMFPNLDERISGEITPSYSLLKKHDILRMHKINPDLKIVFLIRDPIERAWSHIRFRKPSVLGNLDAIKLFIDSDEQSLRGDYIKTIENYSSVFSSDNILLCFYDAIISDPQNLLSEVVLFLGGNTNRVKELSTLNNKSNVSKSLEMPIEVYEYLKGKYKKDINKMSSSIGSYSSIWLKKHYGVSNFEVEIKNSVKLNAVSI